MGGGALDQTKHAFRRDEVTRRGNSVHVFDARQPLVRSPSWLICGGSPSVRITVQSFQKALQQSALFSSFEGVGVFLCRPDIQVHMGWTMGLLRFKSHRAA